MWCRILGLVAFIVMIILFIDSQDELKHLRSENARLSQQLRNADTYIESEIAFYQYRLTEQQETIRIIQTSISKEKQKQAKIQEVKNIIRKSIRNLPDDPYFNESRNLSSFEIGRIATYIVDYSDRYDVPLNLSVALIKHESAFNLKAVSRTGAQGLTQLMPATAQDMKRILGKDEYDPWDPQHNVQFGIFYLSMLLNMYEGNQDQQKLAINSYNFGPHNIANNKPLPIETIEHENFVFKYATSFKYLEEIN